jgi:hypothetical protein
MAHIPSLIGATIMFGLCYVLAYTTLTGIQTFLVIAALLVVYSATVIWYLKTTL